MHILYVLNSDKPGGMEKHVGDLVSGMTALSHKVTVVCPRSELSDWFINLGANVINLKVKSEVDFSYIRALSQKIKAIKPDVIHAHELKAVSHSLITAFFCGLKIRITHTHTPISRWKIPLYKRIINIVANSILVNLFATKEVALNSIVKLEKEHEGILSSKLLVLSNGIDYEGLQISQEDRNEYRFEVLENLSIPKDSNVVGNISRLSAEKGHSVLLEAVAELKNRGKYVYCILAGGGVLHEELTELSKKLGIFEQVRITGVFNDDEKVKYLSTFDVLVFPSLAEGFGYVPVESMAFGVPVLASNLPVLKEVCMENINYFKVGDSMSLADSLEGMLARKDQVVMDAKNFVRNNYSLEVFWSKYNNLYTKLYESSVSK